jgi:hypothetical protein
VTDPTYWGQPRYNPHRVRESRLSWRLDARWRSFGSDNANPEPWSLLQSGHAARVRRLRLSWPGCVLRPLRGQQDGSEPGLISGAATPRANQPSQRQNPSRVSLGRRGFALAQAPVWAGPPSGGSVRPCRLREVRVKTVQMAGVQVVSPSGGRMRTLCRTPTYGPALSREARCRGCAATAPATPNAERRPPGCQPARQLRSGG